LGLSADELGQLTPAMFRALCDRRNVRLKHERFANALTASAVYNVNRPSADEPMVSAYDFVRDGKDSQEHHERQTLKRQIKHAVMSMPQATPRAKFLKMRTNIIAQLTSQGRTDAAELWAECWPTLVPKEGE
jgi:hypothetical protein